MSESISFERMSYEGIKMQAKKYKIDTYTSVLDFTHDFHTTIDEIYIQERGIYINLANVFRGDARRFSEGREVIAIEINNQVVRELEKFIEHKERIEQIVQTLFSVETQEAEIFQK